MSTHIDDVAHLVKRLERYDTLKEVVRRISFVGVGK